MYIQSYVYTHMYIHICVYTCASLRTTSNPAHPHTNTHTYIYRYLYVHTYTYVYTCIPALRCAAPAPLRTHPTQLLCTSGSISAQYIEQMKGSFAQNNNYVNIIVNIIGLTLEALPPRGGGSAEYPKSTRGEWDAGVENICIWIYVHLNLHVYVHIY